MKGPENKKFKNPDMQNRNNQQNNPSENKGVVTVNDENNPTPEQRDAYIPKEPGTERLRSERQSVQQTDRDLEKGTEE
jgi:hypothetical protein